MQVKFSQAVSMCTLLLKNKLVPMLIGSPGCGKSSVAYAIAKAYNLFVIDLRLSQCDPTDLLGFPHIFGKKAGYMPMETFPFEGDEIPAGYSGWLLLLDEMNSAKQSVIAAAYKLILDRMVGVHKLHPNVVIMAAGNLETDNAIVEPMSTAMQSRMVHLELVPDVEEFVVWAQTNNIFHYAVDYVKANPDMLFTFTPDHTDNTYACPRTWEFASRILHDLPMDHPDMMPLLAGTLSEPVARSFTAYCKYYTEIPKIEHIKRDPEGTFLPDSKGILFALSGSLASHAANDPSFTNIIKYASRLPIEYQVYMLKDAGRRKPEIRKHAAFREWTAKTGTELF